MNDRNLNDWLGHLESLHPKGQGGIELGLERVARVKAALGQTQHCPVIVVGGTNGKGSTCAFLDAIYTAAGYRVGCYTSPHLLAYNERVRVGAAPIDDAALCAAFARVEAARQSAGEQGAEVALTYFEFSTLAAWEVFAAARVEVAILEVGLGGRLDAVNVYDADCAVVTGIALDHTDWLGDTRDAIGFEKAGIFRAGKPALCADPEPPASLVAHAQAIGAHLSLIGRDYAAEPEAAGWRWRGPRGLSDPVLPRPGLPGAWQLNNAATVRYVVELLAECLPVQAEAFAAGLSRARLSGRFQVLPGRPTVILDVAHNPQAAAGLVANLAAQTGFGRTLMVVGMLADKDIEGALAALAGAVDAWFLARLDVPRGASAERLAEALQAVDARGSVARCASPAEALERAAKEAGENDRIVVCGSFYTVAAALGAQQSELR
ncbi:MAG: bifunctional tetrahydrofolate synthase/dihydrofolate synthase [Propionivibrio sp.]